MKSPLDDMEVLLTMDPDFIGPPKPRSPQAVGVIFGGASLTAAVAMLHLNRLALETLPDPQEMVFVITTGERCHPAEVFLFEDFGDEQKQLIESLMAHPIATFPREHAFFVSHEKESKLAPQLSKYGPKAFKSASQLRRDAARLPKRKRR